MAKKQLSKTKQSVKGKDLASQDTFDLDEFLGKYIWVIAAILVVLYYWFSTQSTGFYQDDEIGHFRNIRGFWADPFSIMGNQPKPGWKILLVLPGLAGFPGVILAHSIIAALTVVVTYYTARAMKWKNAIVGAVLLGIQPLFMQLSFRAYSEITAGLFAVLMLYFFVKEKWILAAITSSYIFTIRQEFALISIAMGIFFLYRKQFLPFILLGWTPVVMALIGWMHTGNIMWLLDDMQRIGLGVTVPHKPFWHYFEAYPYIIGPVSLALFLVGYWAFLHPAKDWMKNIKAEWFLFLTFTLMWAWSVFSAWDVPDFGANPGHWRYVISFSPLAALYAIKGINILFRQNKRQYAFIVLGLYAVITLLFLSKETNGLTMEDASSYTHFLFALVVFALFAGFSLFRFYKGSVLVTLLLATGIVYSATQVEPLELDPENENVKAAAEWYLQQPDIQDRPLYGNTTLFRYFAGIDISDKNRDRQMVQDSLAVAPVGSIVVWDNHYGNSQFGGDVPYEYFQDKPEYKLILQQVSPDNRWAVLIFEKGAPIAPPPPMEEPAVVQ